MNDILRDILAPDRLKYAFRSLLRKPVQALTAIILLAVGFTAAGSGLASAPAGHDDTRALH